MMIFSKKAFSRMAGVLAVLCACLAPGWAHAGYANAAYILKVATLVPRGMGWSNQMEKIVIPKIYETTGGNLYLKIYWGGIAGDSEQMLRKVRAGELDGVGLDGQAALLAATEFGVLELPFLFRDYGEVDYIREKMFPVFAEHLKKNGYMFFMWADQDFDQIYSVKPELADPARLARAAFINWGGLLEKKVITSIGAKAIPTTVTGLRQSLIAGKADTVIAPALWMLGIQAHSVVRYVSPLKIRYSPGVLLARRDSLEKLPEEYKKKTQTLRGEITRRFNQAVREDNQKAIKAMLEYGILLVSMTPENEAAIQRATRPVWNSMAGILYPRELLDAILGHLERYRAQKGAGDKR